MIKNQALKSQAPYTATRAFGLERYLLSDEDIPIALNCWRRELKGPLSLTIKLAGHDDFWQRIECDKLGSSHPVQTSFQKTRKGGMKKTVALIHIFQQGL